MLIEDLLPNTNLEDMHTEFKGIIEEGDGRELNWVKSLAAFANTEGGTLYVGVDDKSHKVLALDHRTADKVVQMVHRQIREKVDPAIEYAVEAIAVSDTRPTRYVLRVDVPASRTLPVVVHSNGLLGVFCRRFGRTEIASTEQIRDMVLMSESVPFDTALTDEIYDPGRFTKLHGVYEARNDGRPLTRKELVSIGFMNAAGFLSKGALLFADDCDGERTKVVATQWPSDTKGAIAVLASEEYAGDILSSIEFSTRFVSSRSANGFKKEELTRVDYVAYPARSVTEGIVNAMGHRNYFMQGTQVELNIFKDRLEITSPGSLLGVGELKREHDIASIIPRRRNEVICAVLCACKYMEEKGSGFDKIEEDYLGRGDEYRPFVSSDASSFTLTLPDLTFAGGVVGDANETPEIHVDGMLTGKNDLKVLSYCYRHGRTAMEIAAHLGVTASTYFRSKVLKRLVEQGYLIETAGDTAALYTANTARVFL